MLHRHRVFDLRKASDSQVRHLAHDALQEFGALVRMNAAHFWRRNIIYEARFVNEKY